MTPDRGPNRLIEAALRAGSLEGAGAAVLFVLQHSVVLDDPVPAGVG